MHFRSPPPGPSPLFAPWSGVWSTDIQVGTSVCAWMPSGRLVTGKRRSGLLCRGLLPLWVSHLGIVMRTSRWLYLRWTCTRKLRETRGTLCDSPSQVYWYVPPAVPLGLGGRCCATSYVVWTAHNYRVSMDLTWGPRVERSNTDVNSMRSVAFTRDIDFHLGKFAGI